MLEFNLIMDVNFKQLKAILPTISKGRKLLLSPRYRDRKKSSLLRAQLSNENPLKSVLITYKNSRVKSNLSKSFKFENINLSKNFHNKKEQTKNNPFLLKLKLKLKLSHSHQKENDCPFHFSTLKKMKSSIRERKSNKSNSIQYYKYNKPKLINSLNFLIDNKNSQKWEEKAMKFFYHKENTDQSESNIKVEQKFKDLLTFLDKTNNFSSLNDNLVNEAELFHNFQIVNSFQSKNKMKI